jgi:hypothetical protein
VRAAKTRNYRETKRFTKVRESIEVGQELLHSKVLQPRRACKSVLTTDTETVKNRDDDGDDDDDDNNNNSNSWRSSSSSPLPSPENRNLKKHIF